MANLSKTRTLFAFTSPRTIEKIVPEIKLLTAKYSGQVWNQDTQTRFFQDLVGSEFYEGQRPTKNQDFAARDRINRAPKALGFVDLKPAIQLTDAGYSLLSGKRIHERITKQLLKFQFPSPYHPLPSADFFVRPYLELLRLTNDLGGLSKTEIALFFTQITHIEKYDKVAAAMRLFREASKRKTTSRSIYVEECFEKAIVEIYAAEIAAGEFATRESDEVTYRKFVRTKRTNMQDYADAFFRYLRATTLITLEKRTFRMIISPSKRDEVEFILANTPREPVEFAEEQEFKEYLFSAANMPLLVDDETLLLAKLSRLGKSVRMGEMRLEQLKDLLEITEDELLSQRKEQVSSELKNFNEYDDIVSVFDQIKRKEVPDPALFLEWNVWRSLVMLNYAVRTEGNFVMDLDGMPVNTAPGKVPDIEVDYGDFGMIVEVTTSTGQKQYEMEGEPVARHYGKAQETKKNMYCLFIAPAISEGTLAHYFNLNRMNTKHYGGKTRIIPLSVAQFVDFLAIARKHQFSDPSKVELWLSGACAFNQVCEDEVVWQEHIASTLRTWAA
jgi:hypothetical protein